jgi:putative ABC transport system permease protein
VLNDIQYGLRQLIKNPGFTLVASLTLALGIGANTAIFSVVNAVLLKPLPFSSPDQLVAVGMIHAREPSTVLESLSYPDYFDFRDQNQTLSSIAIHRNRTVALVKDGEAQSIRGEKVSSDFFDVLGIKPAIGRAFVREDEKAGGGPGGFKVILGDALWKRLFNRDPSAIGQVLMFDNVPYTVIGVMPPRFQYPIETEGPEYYITIAEDAANADGSRPQTEQRGNHSLDGIARLKPGVTLNETLADFKTIAARLEKQYPDSNTDFSAGLRPLREELLGDVRTALYVLFGAVVCVLLIANANVANLLLARATVRAKEIAVRTALGASRSRIIRQLLTESLILAGIGGILGLLIAQWGTEALITTVPQNIPRITAIQLDGAVLAFTLLVSLGTGMIFGLVPAWQASDIDLNTALKTGARIGTDGEHKHRLRNGLVMSEVALALVLLVCAGLLIQSFARLGRVKPGIQTDRLLTARIQIPDVAYPKPENAAAFFDRLLPAVKAIPGVKSASYILPLPLSGSQIVTSFDIEERPLPEGKQNSADNRVVGLDYFQTMGIPLLQGRTFAETDQLKSNLVMMINERFAQKYFPGQNPIGKRMQPGWGSDDSNKPPYREIIGIVGNVKHNALNEEFTPEMYLPATQAPVGLVWLVVRTSMENPSSLTSAIRAELAKVDKNIPLTRVRIFDEYLSRTLSRPRFNALLLSIFAGTALVLTAIGIYGVMAYSVAQRTNEIGIRMALGAAQSAIFKLVVGQAMTLVAVSLALGLIGAFAAARLLRSLLFGVGAWDPLTFAAIVLLLTIVAFLAAWLPARRAARVDPVVALRAE